MEKNVCVSGLSKEAMNNYLLTSLENNDGLTEQWLENGAEVTCKNGRALFLAINLADEHNLELLCSYANQQNRMFSEKELNEALFVVCSSDKVKSAELLLERYQFSYDTLRRSLICSARSGKSVSFELTKILIDKILSSGYHLDEMVITDTIFYLIELEACEVFLLILNSDDGRLKKMLQGGQISTIIGSNLLNVALLSSVRKESYKFAKLLIDIGADLEYDWGMALTEAMKAKNVELINYMIQFGANIQISLSQLLPCNYLKNVSELSAIGVDFKKARMDCINSKALIKALSQI